MRITEIRMFRAGVAAMIAFCGARTLQASPVPAFEQIHRVWYADSVVVGAITGSVIDSVSKRPMSGVIVKISGTRLAVVTDDSGKFVFQNVPAGEQALIARQFSYRPNAQTISVRARQSTTVQLSMQMSPSVLAGVVITDMDAPDQSDSTEASRDTVPVK